MDTDRLQHLGQLLTAANVVLAAFKRAQDQNIFEAWETAYDAIFRKAIKANDADLVGLYLMQRSNEGCEYEGLTLCPVMTPRLAPGTI